MRWALISATTSPEKAATVALVVASLERRNVRVGGFAQIPAPNGEDHALSRIGAREQVPLGRRGTVPRSPTEEIFCSFAFDRRAFERAKEWLRAGGADVVVVDELGKLEAAGRGHAEALELALASGRLVLAVVRAHQLPYIVDRFRLGDPVATLEPPFDGAAIEAFCEGVARAALRRMERSA